MVLHSTPLECENVLIVFSIDIALRWSVIPFLKYTVALIVEILQDQSPSRDREVAPTEDSFQ